MKRRHLMLGSLAAATPLVGGAGAGGVAHQAGALHRALRAGRRHRHGEPADLRPARQDLRPVLRGRQQGRRRRQHRHGRARPRGARRLHARPDLGGEPHAQPDALQPAALRSRQGHRRDVAAWRCWSNLLGVTQALPANTVAELIALCKKAPGKYSFASSGPGSSLHLSGELFKAMAGVDIIHVPYKGAGAAYGDLISGTVQHDVRQHAVDAAAGARRQGEGPGRHLGRALQGRARHSGDRRDAAGLCRDLVVRRSARRPARPSRSSPGSRRRSARR